MTRLRNTMLDDCCSAVAPADAPRRQVQTSASPQPSSGLSFSYDGTTKSMLLFGGWVGHTGW
jgi:hypothetical protein